MRFIHSADWQIGKSFRQFGEKESILRQARLDAIETLGRLALAERARFVLVAGDVYDNDVPSRQGLYEPIERMKRFSGLDWYLLPGNHDPHRPHGLWDQLQKNGLPDNIRPLLASVPFLHAELRLAILPAPLLRKAESADGTQWMDRAETPSGWLRIGLAHSSIKGFDSAGEAKNLIDPRRPELAGLDYLALGDWHRGQKINDKLWYAGTPEADRWGGVGQALVVEVDPGRMPQVSVHKTGKFKWVSRQEEIHSLQDWQLLQDAIRQSDDPSHCLMRLRLTGHLSLAEKSELEAQVPLLQAAFFHVDIDDEGLHCRSQDRDLEAIDFDGVLRKAAERLKVLSNDENRTAAQRQQAEMALFKLFEMAGAAERSGS